jgi:hypothetical protein
MTTALKRVGRYSKRILIAFIAIACVFGFVGGTMAAGLIESLLHL